MFFSACGPATASVDLPTATNTPRTPTLTATYTLRFTRTSTSIIPVSGGQSFPHLTVSQLTNCRSGPGADYLFIYSLLPGQVATVLGKFPAQNYWIINTPSGGVCWIWGQFASVTGDTSGVNVFSIPPVPSKTFTRTRTNQPTSTYTSTYTSTFTFTPTNTFTFTPTYTPTRTPTSTFTITQTPTITNTLIPTFTFTFTPSLTSSPTLTPSQTNTPVVIPTFTPSATLTNTPIDTPLPTNTLTDTPQPTDTPTDTPIP
jgi:hypothetical protein